MQSDASPPMAASRRHQMFPVLGEEDIARLRRFGTEKSYGRGEFLFKAGEHSPGMAVLLAGHVLVTQRDGLGHISPIVELGPGEFTAEISQLSGKPALVDAEAVSDAVAILIPPHRLRAVFVEEADLGERIMRALILRRVALLESHTVGPTLIGPPSPDVFRLESFLSRNGFPYHRADPASDAEAAALLQHYAPDGDGLPLVVCANGAILKNPSEAQLARCIGMTSEPDFERIYDVTVAGAGPAGLATAVYAASEGLSVIVLDARAFGGQAAPAPGSKTISASQPASRAKRSPAAASFRRRNLEPRSPSPSRPPASTAGKQAAFCTRCWTVGLRSSPGPSSLRAARVTGARPYRI